MNAVDLLVRLAGWSTELVGIVWLVTAAWFAAVKRDSVGGKVRHFFGTLLPEPWMIVGIVVIIVALHLLPHGMWDPITWHVRALVAVGALLVIAGSALMVWARLALGAMWAGRPMIQQEHELRTGGPYQVVRHPIYTGILAIVGGAVVMTGGSSFVVFAFVLAWLLRRVRVEDRMLVGTFGSNYEDYRHQVPALVPFAPPRARELV